MKIAKPIAIVAVLGVVGAGVLMWSPVGTRVLSLVNGNASVEAPLVLYGNVDIREVEMAFRQPGRLTAMAFDEGDAVRAGDVLAEIDAQPVRDAVAIAEAEVRRVRAELDKLYSGSRPQEIGQAEAAVQQAEASARNAEREYQRKSVLLASRTVSQSTVDTARAMRDEAVAALAVRQQALALAQAGARAEDIAAGEASLAVAQARLAQARTALADTRLMAPADAVVLSRVREPGSMVSTSAPVYTLSLRQPVYIRAYVAEPDLGRVAPGTTVRVLTDASDTAYEGQVGFVSPRAEFTPKSVETTELRTDLVYRLRIVVKKADDRLRQGMPVTVRVDPAPTGG